MAKGTKVKITMPFGTPKHILVCDRFDIRRDGDFVDLDFANERTGQSLTVRMATEEIGKLKAQFLTYRGDAQRYVTESPAPPMRTIHSEVVVFADVAGMSHHGKAAEFAFHGISWSCALGGPQDDLSRAAYYVASIRCSLDMQLHWVGILYTE